MKKWLFWKKVRRELLYYHLDVAEVALRYKIFGILDKETIKKIRKKAVRNWRIEHDRL